mmetsp:Transcript_26000/g.30200  ORF Transcript_26000/g.30200 Transcript_26000/m.30200 type:complete len:91 (-) Transcript_26000:313-585(-)
MSNSSSTRVHNIRQILTFRSTSGASDTIANGVGGVGDGTSNVLYNSPSSTITFMSHHCHFSSIYTSHNHSQNKENVFTNYSCDTNPNSLK